MTHLSAFLLNNLLRCGFQQDFQERTGEYDAIDGDPQNGDEGRLMPFPEGYAEDGKDSQQDPKQAAAAAVNSHKHMDDVPQDLRYGDGQVVAPSMQNVIRVLTMQLWIC